jgi:AMP phosphorylase
MRAFKAKIIDVITGGKNIIVLTSSDATDIGVDPLDRVKVTYRNRSITAIVDFTTASVKPGEVGLFVDSAEKLGIKNKVTVHLELMDRPVSTRYIRMKMDKKILSTQQINAIINDLMNDSLSDVELTAFITALYINGMTEEETIALTKAIVNTGSSLKFNKPVFSKHSIGGVPGNRTTTIIVPIIAAAGLTIPKTSSRAITSPAGTADTMEVLAPVNLTKSQIENVVRKTKGCIVWGGAVNLAAADDKLIRVRHPLKLDPKGVLLASILAKKKAEGATHVLVDIPIGRGAKIYTKSQAEELSKDFIALGIKLDMEVQCIITPGYDPIGAAIGPALEARETMRILEGEKVSHDLIKKSLIMAGILLEMAGKASPGKGMAMAEEILASGKALAKMREIIKAQGGNPRITSRDIKIGSKMNAIQSKEAGRIHFINTDTISAIAIAAGAPNDKGAGVYMHVEKGDKIKKGDRLFTIYSDSKGKLDEAIEIAETRQVIDMDRVILGRTSSRRRPYVYNVS